MSISSTLKEVFQSTRPRGARPNKITIFFEQDGFNPRAHVGRDKVSPLRCMSTTVSIHAPTWGATADWWKVFASEGVSIHAPTWGATMLAMYHKS